MNTKECGIMNPHGHHTYQDVHMLTPTQMWQPDYQDYAPIFECLGEGLGPDFDGPDRDLPCTVAIYTFDEDGITMHGPFDAYYHD